MWFNNKLKQIFFIASCFVFLFFSSGNVLAAACGSATQQSWAVAPTTNLCSSGTEVAVTLDGDFWTWMCLGGTPSVVSCSAPYAYEPSPVCGSANGVSTYTTPTALCSIGTSSSVTESGIKVPYTNTPISYTTIFNWSCTNGAGTVSCSAPKKIDAECTPTWAFRRTALCNTIFSQNAGAYVTNECMGNICKKGTQTTNLDLPSGVGGVANCSGHNGGTSKTCYYSVMSYEGADMIWLTGGEGVAPIDGICGPSNGGAFTSPPSSSLCYQGAATGVTTGSTTYTWSCVGSNGGATASCFANIAVNGSCGSANGQSSYDVPTNLCNTGTASSVTTNTTTFGWTCAGSNGGTTASCSSNQLSRSIPCGSYGDTSQNGSINYYDVQVAFSQIETLPLNLIDVNGNGDGEFDDLYLIREYVIGNITTFSICSRVNGVCGTANTHGYQATSYIDTAAERCSAGTFSGSFTDNTSSWSWSCVGISGGTTASCSAPKVACGTYHNTVRRDQPSTNLCAYGSNTTLNLSSNIWLWSCTNNPGVDAACYTYKTTCGPSNGGSFSSAPSTNLCTYGTASSVTTGASTYTWTCTGNDSLAVNCSATRVVPVNGTCGSSNGGTFSTAPSTNLCSAGSATSVTTNTSTYTWSCTGSDGGTTASCSASRIVNGVCGSSNGGTFSTAPSTNLCSAGTASAVSGTGPWTWTCNGINGGTTASCSANLTSVNGSCGTANTHGYASTSEIDTAAERCAVGTFTSFTDAGSSWTWSCTGSGGGTTASCSAPKVACGTYHNTVRRDQPSTNLCAYGSNTTLNLSNNIWLWSCTNNPGVDAACYTYKTTCGPSNGGSFSSAPSTNLCTYGTASSVTTGASTYTWTCTGNDSLAVSCSANIVVVGVGTCGSSNGGTFSTAPSTNLCSTGTASAVSGSGPWAWTCTASSPWLTNYSKRKPITVSSSSALTNYQVKVVVAYDSDMQADFDDIRFTASDGTTELSYWLESKTDSSTATFWVKVPSLASGSNTIYVYYGNASATTASSGDNTFVLFDDFNSGTINTSKWTATCEGTNNGGSVSIVSGELVVTARSSAYASYAGCYLKSNQAYDLRNGYAVRYYAKQYESSGQGLWWYGGFYLTNSTAISVLQNMSTYSGNDGTPDLFVGENSGSTIYNNTNYPGNHTYEIRTNGTTVTFLSDGSALASNFTLAAQNGYYEKYLQFYRYSDQVIYSTQRFDNVIIRKYVASEPTASLGVEESDGVSIAYCSAEKTAIIDGVCGLANGAGFSATPSTNLCLFGTASTIFGTGPWIWTCNGINGGTNANCYASTIVNGVCGSNHGGIFGSVAPTANLCALGTASAVADNTTTYNWTCIGGSTFGTGVNSAWAKRKQINVWNPNGTLTNYQVKINTDVLNETGLVGSWHFNEASGTVLNDSSGNANNGAITGTTVVSGKFGNARSFNGTSNYVAVQDSPSLRISNYTVEVWIKPNGTPDEEWKGIIGKPGRNFNMWLNNDGYIHHRFHNSTNTNSGIADTPVGSITWDAWNHIVITNDGTTAKTYINGIEKATGSSGGSQIADSTILYMGRSLDGNSANYFNGLIDGVRIYNRALGATEIANHYNSDARLDYEDIRFTSSDGTTELNYWKEKDGTFWVKVPSLITYGNTIYMYYGNRAATSTSNFSNTFGTGLKSWLKADSLAGIANGGLVATLIDDSGNNNNATQATSTKQPAYTQNILNGKPVLRFTAANSQTMTVSANFPAPTTVIYVSKLNGGVNGRMLSGLVNNWLLGYHGGLRQRAYFVGWLNEAVSAAVDTNPYIYTATIGGSGINSIFYENGASLISSQGGVTGPNGLSFSGHAATSEFSNGDVAEILVYDNVLSDMNRLGIERYLAGKYGITYASSYTEPTITVFPETDHQVTSSCSATKETSKPLCGLANGIIYAVAPANYLLCSGGTPSALSGSNPWTWTCTAGTAVNCSTKIQPDCGLSDGGSFSSAPTTNLCDSGIASQVTETTTWDWTCSSSPWYNSSWLNRKPITITSSQAITDYQVKIDTDLYNENNLAGSWHFNEPSGTVVYDSSGNTISSTLTGTTIATGKFGNSKNFSATTDTMLLSPTISLASTDYTIETWFEYPLPSTAAWNTLVRGAGGDHQVIVQRSTMELGFYSHAAPTGFHGSGFKMNTLSNGWHHLVAVGSGSTTAYYIDGEYKGLVNKKSITDIYSIGNYQGGRQQFGNIDETRIYKRALSATEIANHYNNKARPDYEDIRFTSSDGATELNYWKEKDGTFWVKVPSLASGSNTIYMYYNNASAVSASNGNNVFDFFDDFGGATLDTNKWTPDATFTTTFSNSILRLQSSAPAYLYSKSQFSIDHAFRTNAKLYSTDHGMTFAGFISGTNNLSIIVARTAIPLARTSTRKDGVATQPDDDTIGLEKYTVWEAAWYANHAKYYRDNIEFRDTTTNVPVINLSAGFIQNKETTDADAYFDWALVRKRIASEPTAIINGAETYPGASSTEDCSANKTTTISAASFQTPVNINSDESCWYCSHYVSGTEVVPAIGGGAGNLQFKFDYQSSSENMTGYQFAIGSTSDVNAASTIKSSNWVSATGPSGTTITVSSLNGFPISVKRSPSSSLSQIAYNTNYYWWVKVKSATQESDWIPAGTYMTATHQFPVTKVVFIRSGLSNIQACTTVKSLTGTHLDDPCFSACWKGAGTTVDLTSENYVCSVCYNSSTNLPQLCGTVNNPVTWSPLPANKPVGFDFVAGSDPTMANPIFSTLATGETVKLTFKITGSDCPLEGELNGTSGILPRWQEKSPY